MRWRRALGRVLDAGDRGAALGMAGRQRAVADFSIEKMAERYRELYLR